MYTSRVYRANNARKRFLQNGKVKGRSKLLNNEKMLRTIVLRDLKPQLRADGRFSVLFYARRAAIMPVVIPSMKRFHDNARFILESNESGSESRGSPLRIARGDLMQNFSCVCAIKVSISRRDAPRMSLFPSPDENCFHYNVNMHDSVAENGIPRDRFNSLVIVSEPSFEEQLPDFHSHKYF